MRSDFSNREIARGSGGAVSNCTVSNWRAQNDQLGERAEVLIRDTIRNLYASRESRAMALAEDQEC